MTGQRIVRLRDWTCWSGTTEDLARIAAKFKDAVELRRTVVLRALDDKAEEAADDFDKRTAKRDRNQLEIESEPKLSITAGTDTISGAIDEILPQIDPREVEVVFFSAVFARFDENDQVTVRIRKDDPKEVLVRVTSPDGNWSRSTFASLSEEVAKGVPRWARFRKFSYRSLLAIVAYLVTFFASGIVLASYSATRPAALYVSLAIGLAAQGIVYVDAVRDWFFPPFELREGRQSTGSRRLALLAGILLSVPVGILVNVLSPG